MSGSKTVSVIGLGYIGLPTAAAFAARQVQVIGVDVDPNVVETISRGEIHIVEPDLDMVVRAAVSEGWLRVVTAPEPADAFLIAVPTPFKGDNREPDLRFIEAAAKAIAPVLKQGNLVVLESTSPVGATEKMADWLAEARPDLTFPQSAGERSDIRVAHCPERVLPGHVMRELVENDRIIGGMTQRCSDEAIALYRTFVAGACIVTNARTAEMAKLTENSFRDVNIAFANEISIVCDALDIDVWELIALSNRHPRVNILQPGAGVGGHCIAVDPWFIVSRTPELTPLMRTAREVNDGKPLWVLDQIRAAIAACVMGENGKRASDVSVACYGITFKPDIDDLRGSPALEITRDLAAEHTGPLTVIEPNVDALPDGLRGARHVRDVNVDADVHVLLVDHSVFKGTPIPAGRIVDVRGVWSRRRTATEKPALRPVQQTKRPAHSSPLQPYPAASGVGDSAYTASRR